jgi:hypothetical protein
MKNNSETAVYEISVADIQEVADEVLERPLTDTEIKLVENSLGDYIDWFQAIENAIRNHLPDKVTA